MTTDPALAVDMQAVAGQMTQVAQAIADTFESWSHTLAKIAKIEERLRQWRSYLGPTYSWERTAPLKARCIRRRRTPGGRILRPRRPRT